MLSLLIALVTTAQEAPLAVEQDGLVVLEVESHPPASGWEQETRLAGFTGTAYVRNKGGSLMTFPIYITRPGRYRMHLRNRHEHPDSTLENDAFVRIGSGPFIKCFSGIRGEWTWASTLEYSGSDKVPADYDLAAGLHKVEIRGRSENFMIDRIALYLLEGDRSTRALDPAQPETRGIPPRPPLEGLPKAAAAWDTGRLGTALKELDAAGEAAARPREILRAYIDARRAAFEETRQVDPLAASDGLAFYAQRFLAGSDAAREFMDLARTWKSEPAAQQELRARPLLALLEKEAEKIQSRGSVSDDRFARQHARPLAAIRQLVAKLRSAFPDTWARRRADALADGFGLKE